MIKPSLCIILLLLLVHKSKVFSQDISGTWVGNYGFNPLMAHPIKLVVEINVYNDSLITGISHLYYTNQHYVHYRISGIYHKYNGTLRYKEESIIDAKLWPQAVDYLGTYIMKLKVSDSSMRQRGRWTDFYPLKIHNSSVWLEKKIIFPEKNIDSSAKDKVDSVPVVPQKILARQTDIQSLIEIPDAAKDSIKIQIYDNGEVDNDSVSVFTDDKEIISHQRISDKAITFYVSLTPENPIRKIRLVAESLGAIPPCTAVMIITTKQKRYETSLSSNFNKNATVELFLKE